MTPRQHSSSSGLPPVFRALRHRNFRIFYYGQSFSLIGTWMQMVAVSWLVYRLTESAFLLGCVGFVTQIPAFVLAPLAGVIADRYERRRILFWVQALGMLQASVLAVLVFSGSIIIWQILLLGFFLGLINAFDLPVRQAFVSEMIDDRKDLANAIALHSSLFNASRLIGPAIAGILIAAFGEGVCFAVNAVSFIPVLFALSLMRLSAKAPEESYGRAHVFAELKEGFFYVVHSHPIRTLLLLLSAVSFFTGALQTLMPVFVREVYHHGPRGLGFILSMSGVGALLGALILAQRQSVLGLGRLIGASTAGFALLLLFFGMVGNIFLAGGMVFLMGLFMILSIGGSNVVLQTIVEENKRGRVMSFYGAGLVGMTPLGSLLAGFLAGPWGLAWTLSAGGIICLGVAGVYGRNYPSFRLQLRKVYAAKGIIPEV